MGWLFKDPEPPTTEELIDGLHDLADAQRTRAGIAKAWAEVPVRPVPRAVPLAELDERRARREARRAVARVAAAGRVAQVRRLVASAAASGGFGPGEAA